jgi:hypothetical protein
MGRNRSSRGVRPRTRHGPRLGVILLSATGFSGIPAFIEVVDTDAHSHFQDPLKARIEELRR